MAVSVITELPEVLFAIFPVGRVARFSPFLIMVGKFLTYYLQPYFVFRVDGISLLFALHMFLWAPRLIREGKMPIASHMLKQILMTYSVLVLLRLTPYVLRLLGI